MRREKDASENAKKANDDAPHIDRHKPLITRFSHGKCGKTRKEVGAGWKYGFETFLHSLYPNPLP
jgi:hypothetical protein